MQVDIIEEAGYNSALYGFSLSYKDRAISREEWWNFEEDILFNGCYGSNNKRMKQTVKTATANAGRGMGHDKWLRQVQVWVDVEAPLSWWKQMDQYKVGTVSQSESTMHCLHKRDVTLEDFESTIIPEIVEIFNAFKNGQKRSTKELNDNLPLGYKQRRVVSMNYQNLRDIIMQRSHHKLKYWVDDFIDSIYEQAAHPELLPKRNRYESP